LHTSSTPRGLLCPAGAQRRASRGYKEGLCGTRTGRQRGAVDLRCRDRRARSLGPRTDARTNGRRDGPGSGFVPGQAPFRDLVRLGAGRSAKTLWLVGAGRPQGWRAGCRRAAGEAGPGADRPRTAKRPGLARRPLGAGPSASMEAEAALRLTEAAGPGGLAVWSPNKMKGMRAGSGGA
jgi:hypothetical protein